MTSLDPGTRCATVRRAGNRSRSSLPCRNRRVRGFLRRIAAAVDGRARPQRCAMARARQASCRRAAGPRRRATSPTCSAGAGRRDGGAGGVRRRLRSGRMLDHYLRRPADADDAGYGQATGLGNDQTQMLLRILRRSCFAYLANIHVRRATAAGVVAPVASAPAGFPRRDWATCSAARSKQIGQQQGRTGGLLGRVLGGGGGGMGGLLGGILGGGNRT